MAGNPRVVTADTVIHWDGVTQRLPRGQVMDVTPGSALEAAIGRDRLVPLRGAPVQAPAAEAAAKEAEPATPVEEPKAAEPPKPKLAAKNDDKDGEP